MHCLLIVNNDSKATTMKAEDEPPNGDSMSVGSQSTDLFSFDSSTHRGLSMLPDVVRKTATLVSPMIAFVSDYEKHLF